MKTPAVYLLASKPYGTLSLGGTGDLARRVWEHRNDFADGCTKRYGVHRLVYYELHANMVEAIVREKQLKKWRRAWKIRLINELNPSWDDLWASL